MSLRKPLGQNLQRFVVICGAVLLLSTGIAQAQDTKNDPRFHVVPRDHKAYDLVDRLQKAGVVIWYPTSTYSGHSPAITRYEFAVTIARLLNKLDGKRPTGFSPKEFSALRGLVGYFEPELKSLGVSLPDVYRILANLEPFSNVPTEHWAATSVERLRDAGIVIGYPDGEF